MEGTAAACGSSSRQRQHGDDHDDADNLRQQHDRYRRQAQQQHVVGPHIDTAQPGEFLIETQRQQPVVAKYTDQQDNDVQGGDQIEIIQ